MEIFMVVLLVISSSTLVGFFCFFRGCKLQAKESQGMSTRILDLKCVYCLFNKVQIDNGPLLLALKEKTPDGIERVRSKILETSLLNIRDEFLCEYFFENLPEYFSYEENEIDNGHKLLVFKSIGFANYEKFEG